MNPDNHTAALADMQRRGMRDALAFGRATTGMFERLTRQNYAVMGDVVDYALSQLRIPTVHTDPRSALEAQAAGTRAAVEKARVRATEYAAIAGELRDVVGNVAGTASGTVAETASGSVPVTAPKPEAVAPMAEAAPPKPEAVAPMAEAAPPKPEAAAPKAEVAPMAASGKAGTPSKSAPKANVASKPATGSPIIVPGDTPKAVARKTARAAPANAKGTGKVAAANKPAAKTSAKKKPVPARAKKA